MTALALHNHYRLMFGDSFSHINFAFTLSTVDVTRPVFYGLLIALVRWLHSLWVVLFAQSLLVALVLNIFFDLEKKNR